MRSTTLIALLLLSSCATTAPAVDRGVKVRPETRHECAAMCSEMDMRLSAVVLVQNSAACVCEPNEVSQSGSVRVGSAAAAVAGARIVAARREDEARERREQEAAEEDTRRREEEERRRREQENRPHRQEPRS